MSRYGLSVRIKRGTRFIFYSQNLWKKLRRNIPNLRTEGFQLKLTESKEVSVVVFYNEKYVNFHCTYKDKSGVVRDSYINMNSKVWAEFYKALDGIDLIIPVDDIAKCATCNGAITVVFPQKSGRMKTTLLDQLGVTECEESNEINTMAGMTAALRCNYCGAFCNLPSASCHCHLALCRECEPAHFCTECGASVVMTLDICE